MHDLPTYDAISGTLPLKAKVGQLFMPAAFIHDSEENVRALEALIREHHIGGLCFFHSRASAATNFEGAREVPYHRDSLQRLQDLIARYQAVAKYPLLMAMDAEWGLAMRVEHTPQYPYAIALGALAESSESLLYELGLRMARDLDEAGIHWNLSPVVDINTNPENPVISYRSFGSHPETVSRKALRLYKGLRDGGVLTCLKHFPGHGDTAVDSHLALPVLRNGLTRLNANELVPFRELIAAGVPAVMPGHLALPALDPTGLPASLSGRILSLLREALGFKGVIISDALNMHALKGFERSSALLNSMALKAGNDILCFAEEVPESIDHILETMDPSRLEESFLRVWRLKESVFLRTSEPPAPGFDPPTMNRVLAGEALCEVRPLESGLADIHREGSALLYYGEHPSVFADRVRNVQAMQEVPWTTGKPLGDIRIPEVPHIVLVLTPPSMKPAGNFGLPPGFIDEVSELCRQKKVVLYLFGNPYLLHKLPLNAFHGIVCAFQPLEAFQEVAADHFLGRAEAKGTLPIELNRN